MENKILIHKNVNYSKIIFKWIFALIPLIVYGLYKNGIVLYLNEKISFFNIFKPLMFPVLGLLIGLAVNFITKKRDLVNNTLLNGLLVGMLVPLSTNVIVFLIVTFGLLYANTFVEKKLKFNVSCLIKLVVILVLILMKNYMYANDLELIGSHAYSFIDLLFGRQVGGVCATSVVWIMVGFIYLLTDYYYKKEIPIVAYLTYLLVIGISLIFTKDLAATINLLIAATPMFVFTFIAPISEYSPYTYVGKIIYGILLGLLTALLSFIFEIEAAFIVVLIISFFKTPIDMFFGQKITK